MSLPPEFSPEDRLAARLLERMGGRPPDSGGLRELYQLYQRPLMSLVLTIVRETGVAEEILQDVFVKAFTHARRYDPERGTPFTWLATLSRRKSIDWLRKQQRRPQLVAPVGEQAERFTDKDSIADESDVQKQFEARFVREHLEMLSPGQREAIEMAFLEGFSHYEIADRLGKPLGTVKSHLRRGLAALRTFYLDGNGR
ncbi:MAG: sigma-70 family RNA polymerase sigma factor [Oceanipulchritudo sp.]